MFTDTQTGHSTRVDPRGLPEGFSMHVHDAQGKVFFQRNGATQWEDPRAALSLADRLKLCTE